MPASASLASQARSGGLLAEYRKPVRDQKHLLPLRKAVPMMSGCPISRFRKTQNSHYFDKYHRRAPPRLIGVSYMAGFCFSLLRVAPFSECFNARRRCALCGTTRAWLFADAGEFNHVHPRAFGAGGYGGTQRCEHSLRLHFLSLRKCQVLRQSGFCSAR